MAQTTVHQCPRPCPATWRIPAAAARSVPRPAPCLEERPWTDSLSVRTQCSPPPACPLHAGSPSWDRARPGWSDAVLHRGHQPWAATLNKLRLNKIQVLFLNGTSHTANAQWPHGQVATMLERAHAERFCPLAESCWTAAGRNAGVQ